MTELNASDLPHIEEIRRLKSRYCRMIDCRQWERLGELFAPDAKFEGFTIVSGQGSPSEFINELAKRLEGALTVHHCHTPEIRISSPDEAEGVWAMMNLVEWPHPVNLANFSGATGFCGYGFYEERYRRFAGAWRIAHMRLARTRFDPLIGGDRPQEHDPFRGLTGFTRPSAEWMS
ncbi:nuclear transport factor 2 family protein [Plastoroseomonas hellenica]|uniref:nuclear transport factor 2 family protein n=1 Tax=Plastoroseomonas hellenica TaxID=2687306 RepID=UPI001BADF3CB|nr:nuclear transport factor 2 family protein [Plastoroseomonas hellenica]MBR0642713.1 nuclear transport factor 2 family protein [Plastoroseomonas hellenica]